MPNVSKNFFLLFLVFTLIVDFLEEPSSPFSKSDFDELSAPRPLFLINPSNPEKGLSLLSSPSESPLSIFKSSGLIFCKSSILS